MMPAEAFGDAREIDVRVVDRDGRRLEVVAHHAEPGVVRHHHHDREIVLHAGG